MVENQIACQGHAENLDKPVAKVTLPKGIYEGSRISDCMDLIQHVMVFKAGESIIRFVG